MDGKTCRVSRCHITVPVSWTSGEDTLYSGSELSTVYLHHVSGTDGQPLPGAGPDCVGPGDVSVV